jgi:hypothetical protein
MMAASIPPSYSVTSIRRASITKHYDKNNNQQARAMLADLADDEHQESERE